MSTTIEVSVLELASAMSGSRQLLRMRQQIALLSLFSFSYGRMISQPAVGTIHPPSKAVSFTNNSNRSELTAHSNRKRRNRSRSARISAPRESSTSRGRTRIRSAAAICARRLSEERVWLSFLRSPAARSQQKLRGGGGEQGEVGG